MRKRMKSEMKEREISREDSKRTRERERERKSRERDVRKEKNTNGATEQEGKITIPMLNGMKWKRANPFEWSWRRETSAKCSHAEDITMAM